MKVLAFFFTALLIGCTSTTTTPKPMPKTLESAVNSVLLNMTDRDKSDLKNTPRGMIIVNHSPFGEKIKLNLNLKSSQENNELYESVCANCFCDESDVAMAIICGSWNSLNGKDINEDLSECYIPRPF